MIHGKHLRRFTVKIHQKSFTALPYYYSEDNRYTKLNEAYPRFIAADNLVDIEEENYEDMEEGEGEDNIFTGDIFKDFH